VQAAYVDSDHSSTDLQRRHLVQHNGRNISVTHSTLQMLFEAATNQAEDAVRNVDTNCLLRVERTAPARICVTSLATSATKQQPKCADAALGWEAVRDSALGTNGLKHGMLCRIASPPMRAIPTKAAPSVAVVSFVTSADYLFANWHSFLNKVSYCERTGRGFYLLLGKPTSTSMLNDRPKLLRDSPASPRCEVTEPSNTINIYKTLALLALFRASPNLIGAMYMDADTWFADGSDGANNASISTPEAYFALEPSAHLFGNQNCYNKKQRGSPELVAMNSGLLFFRKSAWSRGFLSMWWSMRCGNRDQMALFHLLLLCMSAATDGRFVIDDRHMYDYYALRQYAVHKIRADYALIAASSGSRWRGDADFPFSGQALEPIALAPQILLLPSAAVRVSPQSVVPGLRSDADQHAATFVCHTKESGKKPDRMRRCTLDRICLQHGGSDRCNVTILEGDH